MNERVHQSTHRHEEGAALIVIVLMAMLMLAALLVVSANLSLSARRTTSDQRAVLPAQYGAESGVAYAKSLLITSQQLMSSSSLPPGTTYGTLKSWIASLCPTATTVPVAGYVKATAGSTVVPGSTISVPQSVKVCDVPSFSVAQANFFAQVIPNTGLAATGYSSAGITPANTADRQTLFDKVFSANRYTTVNGAQVKAGLQPVALFQTDKYSYTLFFRVSGVDSLGSASGSDRRITVRGNDTLHGFTFTFTLPTVVGTSPSFTSFGQFVNKWGDHSGTYGYNNDFSGPFHTNSAPSFRGVSGVTGVKNGSSITIDGALTSAGFNTITTVVDALGNRVDNHSNAINGFVNSVINGNDNYIMSNEVVNGGSQTSGGKNYDLFGATKSYAYTNNGKPASLDTSVYIQVASGNGNPPPKFNADFINMPLNSKNQRDIGNTGGILLNNPLKVQLSTSGGTPAQYQNIAIVPSGGNLSVPVKLRYGTDKKMQIEFPVGSGTYVNAIKVTGAPTSWGPAPVGVTADQFNGMIYADGDIGSLSGPDRPANASTATGAAAIANFAGITVTSQGNTTLTGDVKYETRCLTMSACVGKTNGEYNTKNIFGLYSEKGDIRLAYNPNSSGQNTNPGTVSSAPKNLEIDGYVMAGYGQIIPYNANSSTPYDLTMNGSAEDKGKFVVHGGAIKDTDAIVRSNNSGWNENYYYDGRGVDYSPPGFPTTSVGTPGVDPNDTSVVTSWLPALGKTNPDGTQNANVDFTLINEFRQATNQ